MSRDLLVLNIPDKISPFLQNTDIFLTPLGSREYVLKIIQKAFPEIDISDPVWIVLAHQDYSLRFSLGDEEPIDAMLITVHGKQNAFNEIKHLCELANWRAVDSSTGELLDL